MSYLFPVNQTDRKAETEKLPPVEKTGDDEKDFLSQDNKEELEKQFSEIETKVKELVKNKRFVKSLKLFEEKDLNKNLLKISEFVAASCLKSELLKIAKSIFDVSSVDSLEQEIDTKNLTLADVLAKLVIKQAVSDAKPTKSNAKIGQSNPLEDKNAGFLVHFCKGIINTKIQNQKTTFKSQKLHKKDLSGYLKK